MANIDKAVADRLSAKLEKFDATLSDDERAAFKSMLQQGGLSDEALEQVRGGSEIRTPRIHSQSDPS